MVAFKSKLYLLALWLAMTVGCEICAAETDVGTDDIKFKALVDEMARSSSRLSLSGHKGPYFIDYSMYENDDFSVEASLGAVVTRSRKRGRSLFPTLRVGDYKLDNSNFRSETTANGVVEVDDFAPIDDNYLAIRRALWLATDAKYKNAVETYEEKRAYLLENNVNDDTDDFTKENPFIFLKPAQRLSIDEAKWTDRVKSLSAVFKQFPDLYDSWIRYDERILNTWLVNSEGTRVRYSEPACRYLIFASVKTADGMSYGDYLPLLSRNRDELPPPEVIARQIRCMAERLEAVKKAPHFEYYEGPVLFEGQAAAEFVAQVLIPNLIVKRQKANDLFAPTSNPLQQTLGRRVISSSISVTDDPLATTFGGVDLFGGFEVDEQGVKAQKVVVIDGGVLKTLLCGRTPTEKISRSNGHGVAGDTGELAKNSTVFLESSSPSSKEDLRKGIEKLARDANLEYFYLVRRISNESRDDESSEGEVQLNVPGAISLSPPLLLYKVSIADGSEQLVRGARFVPMTIKVLKDIQAVGDDACAYAVEGQLNNYFHVVSPSLVLRDVEIEEMSTDKVKPPVMTSPLVDESKK